MHKQTRDMVPSLCNQSILKVCDRSAIDNYQPTNESEAYMPEIKRQYYPKEE
jgi:hypothetical protein